MVTTPPEVALRPWLDADEPLLAEWFQCAEVPQYLVPRIRGINFVQADPRAWLPRNDDVDLYGVVAPACGPAPVGIGSLHSPAADAVEIGLIIGEPSIWGRGYGRAAALALAALAFADYRCGRVVARIQPDNLRAQRCFRAVGFDGPDGYANEPVWLTLTRTAWRARMTSDADQPAA